MEVTSSVSADSPRALDEEESQSSTEALLTQLAGALEARKAAEQELRETLAAMIQHQQVGKCGNFRYNTVTGGIRGTEEVFKMFHFPAGTRSCTVEEWLERLHVADRDRIARQFFVSLEKQEDLRFEYRIVVGAGEIKYIRCDGEPDLEHSGELTYFGVLTDVTQQRRAEEAQRAMEADLASALRLASMGELAGAIIHEVNQPLAAIGASAEACRRWMKVEPASQGRALASLNRVVEEAGRAAAIVNGLKSLIQDTVVEPTPFDFGAAIAEVSVLVMGELTRENVMLVTDLAAGLPLASGNRVQIQQIFMNLVRNAVESTRFNPGRRILSISTGLHDGMLSLRVGDNGPGFDPLDVEQLFSPLFTTKASGMGLGLSISRRIAIAHGGTLDAEPSCGGGALFHLRLPIGQEQ